MYDFTAIDFETANSNMNSACSVGLVAVKDLKIVKTDYFLIKTPTNHFRHDNVMIHGITYDDVKNCKNFSGIYPKIKEYIDNSYYLIAHNAQFDMSVLHSCLTTYKLEFPSFKYIDSINLSAPVRANCGNSLSECAKFFNIVNENSHNALADAITCAKIAIASVCDCSKYNTFDSYLNNFKTIRQKSFSDLKANSQMINKSGYMTYSKVNISELKTNVTKFDTEHPLYDKSCVFTGELKKIDKKAAMQKVLDAGGHVKSSVSSKTNFLIVGIQDKRIVGEDGLSTKQEKALELISKGHSISILNEDEFLALFNENIKYENPIDYLNNYLHNKIRPIENIVNKTKKAPENIVNKIKKTHENIINEIKKVPENIIQSLRDLLSKK